ncbi:MAG: excinuclease ABC subunit UvrA [Pirellula sp.]
MSEHPSRKQSATDAIHLRGARQNNLQGIDLDIPLGKLTVICGVSGSGKTSLALDTLYAEGQRRYIESFSAYTRQFLERIDRPRFDSLTNLPASIAITREQRVRNNRSTVGTASEILEYLRIVFATLAVLNCYGCDRTVVAYTPKTVVERLSGFTGRRAMVGFEIEWSSKSDLSEQLFDLQVGGFVRLVSGGRTVHLADEDRIALAKHFDDLGRALVVVDRVMIAKELEGGGRLEQSLATAFDQAQHNGNPAVLVLVESLSSLEGNDSIEGKGKSETILVDGARFDCLRFSSELRCEYCKIEYPKSEPRLYSFNSPIGACEQCEGFGETVAVDMTKVVPDTTLSLRQGAIAPWQAPAYSHELEELIRLADDYGIPVDVPVSKLEAKHWKFIQEGVSERDFGGLNGFFAWLERNKYKLHVRAFLSRWRTYSICANCNGRRLNRNSLAYRFHGKTFAELCEIPVDELSSLISDPALDAVVSGVNPPFHQVTERLSYLNNVGLSYVSLARPMHTLSSGEAQRVRMTTLLGSSLVDMLYVFDEPTVGLHPQDSDRIAQAILGLRDRGNTVVLVEHEPHLIHLADRVIEIGPKAGEHGGRVTFDGSPSQLLTSDCITGQFMNGTKRITRSKRSVGTEWLVLSGAHGRNLKKVDFRMPLNCFTVVVGPSGAGKSSLILDTLCRSIANQKGVDSEKALPYADLSNVDSIRECVAIDQSPIQRSNRSCPATYSNAMDAIRQIYASTADATARGFGSSHFSFNSEAGQCPQCEGLGFTTVNMQFMADLRIVCSDCDGKRYKPDVLEVRFRDLNIAELLEMNVERAIPFFRGHPSVQIKLQPLSDLGLGYLPLGQNLATLSGGESMRLKLASQLAERSISKSQGKLIVMDEPTTGLHYSDIERLVHCIDRLIDAGNTVLVIEHNMQMIECADHLVELGPGAGIHGGRVIAEGDIELLVANPHSITGKYFKKL